MFHLFCLYKYISCEDGCIYVPRRVQADPTKCLQKRDEAAGRAVKRYAA
jgi:hypothetical protein